jgi:hypothetical protein
MAVLQWDQVGERLYETGVDHGVLYIPDSAGVYADGVAWNGLVTVTESPSGAEANPQYADNIKYLNLYSAEEFGGTIEAFTYPDEWNQFDGMEIASPGVVIGQQTRSVFGLSYRTRVGNDVEGDSHGYKLHLIYGATASPSEKAYSTINDSPEPITFSWEFTTVPVPAGGSLRPTALITVDSRLVNASDLGDLEDFLYGTAGSDPSLPAPSEVVTIFGAGLTLATPTEPAYNAPTDTITIPTVTGVQYFINDELQTAGPVVITQDTVVQARPAPGYRFPDVTDTDWYYDWS